MVTVVNLQLSVDAVIAVVETAATVVVASAIVFCVMGVTVLADIAFMAGAASASSFSSLIVFEASMLL